MDPVGHSKRQPPQYVPPYQLRLAPIESANYKEIVSLNRYAVIDVETTGLHHEDSRIIEIGIVIYDNGKIQQFSTYVNPEMPIPAEASKINKIYDSDIADAPKYSEIAPIVYDMLKGYTIIGHNLSFDLSFIQDLWEPLRIKDEFTTLDTLSVSKRYIKNVKNHRLGTLAKHFGILTTGTHRAQEDATTTMKLFEQLKIEMTAEKEREKEQKKQAKARLDAERADRFSSSPLYNMNFVFTGEFTQERDILEAAVQNVGGLVKKTVSGKTKYLVIGDLTGYEESTIAKKVGKADELIAKGQTIEKINELQFMHLIEDATNTMKK